MRRPAELNEHELQWVTRPCHQDEEIQMADLVAQEFMPMVQRRPAAHFDGWLSNTETSGISELQGFAAGLPRDHAAVVAVLSLAVRNGQVEGQVNRPRFIKRSMVGR